MTGESVRILRDVVFWMTNGPLLNRSEALWVEAGVSCEAMRELMDSQFRFEIGASTEIHTVWLTESELSAIVVVVRASAGPGITAYPIYDASAFICVEPEDVRDLQRDVSRLGRS